MGDRPAAGGAATMRFAWACFVLSACVRFQTPPDCAAGSPELCPIDVVATDAVDAQSDVQLDAQLDQRLEETLAQPDVPSVMDAMDTVSIIDAMPTVDATMDHEVIDTVLDQARACMPDAGGAQLEVPRSVCASAEQVGSISVRVVLPSGMRRPLQVELVNPAPFAPSMARITDANDAGETTVELRITHTDLTAAAVASTLQIALVSSDDSCELLRVPVRVQWAGRRCRGAQDLTFGRERDQGKAFGVTAGCPVGFGSDLHPGPNGSWFVAGGCHPIESRLQVFYGYEASEDSTVWKFQSDGLLDGSFGVGGAARTAIGTLSTGAENGDRFHAVRVLADGTIIAGGIAGMDPDFQGSLVHFDATGIPRRAFLMGDEAPHRSAVLRGATGTHRNEGINLLVARGDEAWAMGSQSVGVECEGTPLPGAYSTGYVRVNPARVPAASSYVRMESLLRNGQFWVRDAMLDRMGRMVVVGYRVVRSSAIDCAVSPDTFVARYTVDAMGVLAFDSSFATDGVAVFDAGGMLVPGSNRDEQFFSLIEDTDGTYVLAGAIPLEGERQRATLLRVDARTGALLPFSSGVMFATALCGDNTDGRFNDVIRTEAGYLAVGYCGSGGDPRGNRAEGNAAFLAAFDAMGRLDTNFGVSARGWETPSLLFGSRPGRSQFLRVHPDATGHVLLGNFGSEVSGAVQRNLAPVLIHLWR